MIVFFTNVLRFLTILFCTLYSYAKITASKLKPIHLLFIPVFAACSAGLHFVWVYFRLAVPTCLLAVSVLSFFVGFRRSFFNTLTQSTIALGIAIFFMAVSTGLATVILLPFLELIPEKFQDLVVVVVFGVLLVLMTFLTFKIKRFKKGVAPISNDEVFEKLLFVSVACIFGMTLTFTADRRRAFLELAFIFLSFCCLAVILGWRRLASNRYRKNILDRNVEVLEHSVQAYNEEREKLTEQNAELAKIIHRDNKLLPAMELSVRTILERYPDDAQAAEILKSLTALYAERDSAVQNFCYAATFLPATGEITVDSVLSFLRQKAADCNVTLEAECEQGAMPFFKEQFKDLTEFNAILCDLGENAIIAAKHAESGRVKIILDYAGGFATVKIYDNGAQFDERVIAEMGRTEITTHKNDGGSGIGLVAAFRILKNASASLCIDEFADGAADDGLTKCLIICADGKDLRTVKTARDSVKKIVSGRDDLTLA